jgi:hypothetical protein
MKQIIFKIISFSLFEEIFPRSFPPFLNVKMLIDSIAINLMLNEDISLRYSFSFGRLSCTPYRHHQTIPTRWSFILIEITLSITFLFYYFILVKQIIKEKNTKVKEILKIIDIQPFIYYLAWALRSFFIILFLTIIITGIKLTFFPSTILTT